MVDYSLDCTEQGSCTCFYNKPWHICMVLTDECNCACPPPLPNSHQVADNCVASIAQCHTPPACPCRCINCAGTCDYDCDEGYEWDGEACVPVVVAKPFFKGDGLTWLVMKH